MLWKMEELLYKDKLKDQDQSFLSPVTDVEYGEALRKGPAALKPYGAQRDLQHVWRIFLPVYSVNGQGQTY